MRLIIASLFVFAASLGAECLPPPPQPGPVGDAAPHPPVGDASTSSANACAALARLNCPDGFAANCATTLDHARDSRITRIDVACILTAHDQAEARSCGPVCR